jgi:hypothetical protein
MGTLVEVEPNALTMRLASPMKYGDANDREVAMQRAVPWS